MNDHLGGNERWAIFEKKNAKKYMFFKNEKKNNSDYSKELYTKIQCNLELVTLLVSAKNVTKLHDVTKSNYFM